MNAEQAGGRTRARPLSRKNGKSRRTSARQWLLICQGLEAPRMARALGWGVRRMRRDRERSDVLEVESAEILVWNRRLCNFGPCDFLLRQLSHSLASESVID
jgi:hypothetical protein